MSNRPEIGADGKIPCECCNHKGLRRRGGTREYYTCNYCGGTKRRVPPVGYRSQSQLYAEQAQPITISEYWTIHFKGTGTLCGCSSTEVQGGDAVIVIYHPEQSWR